MSEPTPTPKQELQTIPKPPVRVGPSGLIISDMDGLARFSKAVALSGLAPKGLQTESAIFVAIQMGLEVGLTPMAALQNIAVINGRPSLWGDAQLAVVRGTGELVEFSEWYEVGGKKVIRNPSTYTDDVTAVCRVKRLGYEPTESAFSVADAKLAQLWGKAGPWTQFPARMLRMRARSFALRDQFGDALRGLRSAEEAQDTPPEPPRTTVEVRVEPRQLATVNSDDVPAETQQEAPAPETPAEPASNPRLAIIRSWLAESAISEPDAVARIHQMFPDTDSLATLDEIEAMRPQVINAISRPSNRATFISGIGGGK